MALLCIGCEALVIVLLLAALTVGQPAAANDYHLRYDVQSTMVTRLQATVQTLPRPLPASQQCLTLYHTSC